MKKTKKVKRRSLLYDEKDISSFLSTLEGCNNFNKKNRNFMKNLKLNFSEKKQESLIGRIFLSYKYGKYIFASTTSFRRLLIIMNFTLRG